MNRFLVGNLEKEIAYGRIILETESGKPCEKQIYVDYIELNSKMPVPFPIILKYNEIFIQFSYLSLYAVACPIASVTVLIYNFIQITANRSYYFNLYQRGQQENARNIGPWMNIWQFLIILAVVSNSLILLISSDLKNQFEQATDFFWVIFAYENSILALKMLLSWLIADVPNWVRKELVRLRSEQEMLSKNKEL
jgi:anoctamin-10